MKHPGYFSVFLSVVLIVGVIAFLCAIGHPEGWSVADLFDKS
jgi:hypothetical protein